MAGRRNAECSGADVEVAVRCAERYAMGHAMGNGGRKTRDGVGACILAAGASRRMGAPKLLAPFAGTTLVERAVDEAVASGVGPCAVVTGCYASQMQMLLEGRPVRIVQNRQWESGQASSVACAARWARDEGLRGLLLMVADQPFVGRDHLRNLVWAFRDKEGCALAATACNGRWGNPILFAKSQFGKLEGLAGDRGARPVAAKLLESDPDSCVLVKSPRADAFCDIDTPEELAEVERAFLAAQQ